MREAHHGRAPRRRPRPTGCTTPVSLFAPMTETSARPLGASSAFASDFKSTTPARVTGTVSTGKPVTAAAPCTDGCSMADTRRRSTRAAAQQAPRNARSLASLPPLVNTIDDGRAPTAPPTLRAHPRCARAPRGRSRAPKTGCRLRPAPRPSLRALRATRATSHCGRDRSSPSFARQQRCRLRASELVQAGGRGRSCRGRASRPHRPASPRSGKDRSGGRALPTDHG